MMPSMVIGQHAADYSVVQTENGLEPAFASLQIGANPLAKSDPFLSAANSANWSLSAVKDDTAPQLTFDQRPQYVSSESTGYPPLDPSVPYSWYPYASALNSPLNYTDPLGLAVGDWWDLRSYADAKFFKDTGHSLVECSFARDLVSCRSSKEPGHIKGNRRIGISR